MRSSCNETFGSGMPIERGHGGTQAMTASFLAGCERVATMASGRSSASPRGSCSGNARNVDSSPVTERCVPVMGKCYGSAALRETPLRETPLRERRFITGTAVTGFAITGNAITGIAALRASPLWASPLRETPLRARLGFGLLHHGLRETQVLGDDTTGRRRAAEQSTSSLSIA